MKKNHDDVCEIFCFDEEKVDRGKEKLHLQDTMSVAKIFKALADDTRVKIAYALSQEDELCVCDVANIVGSTMATALTTCVYYAIWDWLSIEKKGSWSSIH